MLVGVTVGVTVAVAVAVAVGSKPSARAAILGNIALRHGA